MLSIYVFTSAMSSKVQHFNQVVDIHQNQQTLNPFSSQCNNAGRRSPRLELSASEYGKPKTGSLTELRGFKANIQVFKDILELCELISSEGKPYNKEGLKMMFFGELFQIYTKINDKVVGILIRGRRHNYLKFEGEMLYQRKDDMVPIYLIKSISDIRSSIQDKQTEIQKQIKESGGTNRLL
ncbi:actin-binding Rho-activating protein-like [Culicoides brevitarsis]|uniref:actin-binding Rho-activating protein-like n=1 Tax=Culicoides brevitarsis TaxID=469753 RepID=UPI00307C1A1F